MHRQLEHVRIDVAGHRERGRRRADPTSGEQVRGLHRYRDPSSEGAAAGGGHSPRDCPWRSPLLSHLNTTGDSRRPDRVTVTLHHTPEPGADQVAPSLLTPRVVAL